MILMGIEVLSGNLGPSVHWVTGIKERKTVKTWFSSVEEIQIIITQEFSLGLR